MLELTLNRPSTAAAQNLRQFIVAHHVGAVIVDASIKQPWSGVLASMGVSMQQVGGVLVYRVPAAWGAGASPVLASAPRPG